MLAPTIKLYQAHISSRKGYCCCYSHVTGNSSCSTWGLRAAEKKLGLIVTIRIINRRLIKCKNAYRYLSEQNDNSEDDHSENKPNNDEDEKSNSNKAADAAACAAIPAPCLFS